MIDYVNNLHLKTDLKDFFLMILVTGKTHHLNLPSAIVNHFTASAFGRSN